METPLPIREARRMFLWVVAMRTILTLLAFVLLLPLRLLGPIGLLAPFPGAIGAILVLVPSLQRALHPYALAIALLMDVTLLITRSLPAILYPAYTDLPLATLLQDRAALVEPFVFLMVPLVLMAWAYGRRGALLGSAWAVTLQMGITVLSARMGLLPEGYAYQALVRIAMICMIPILVSLLAKREQDTLNALEQAHRRLQRHAATLEQLATSRERNRLARDLHDTLAHTLAALTVHLSALRTLMRHDPVAAEQAATEALDIARKGLAESRQAIQALRAEPVATLGLVGAIRVALQAFQTRTGTEARLIVGGDESGMTEAEANALYRVLEEALTNIERHAQAQHVHVRLIFGTDELGLHIRDDGVGFDLATVDAASYGLLGMRERAEMIGARLKVNSQPGQGAEIWCTLAR